MSFIKDLVLAGVGGVRIGNQGVTFDQTVIGDFIKDKVKKTFLKQNTPSTGPRDVTINLDIDAKVDNNIPVVYGTGFVNGQLVDAVLSEDQLTMWYALSLCEVTGNKLNGDPSEIEFLEVYRNGNKLQFNSDGVTVIAEFQGDYPNQERNDKINGLMQVYCYKDGSNNPTALKLQRYPVSHGNANSIFPGWGPNHDMSKLAFALIRMQFSPENDITELGTISFKLNNTMNQPGDVMFDYMTNTRYGCSIPQSEIDV